MMLVIVVFCLCGVWVVCLSVLCFVWVVCVGWDCLSFCIVLCVGCLGGTVLAVRVRVQDIIFRLTCIIHLSAQGVDERMINVHYYYYWCCS